MADIELSSIRDQGFTVLAEGTNPIVDIVLVHGLQGHPKNTWTFQTPPCAKKVPNKRRGKCLDFQWLFRRRNPKGHDARTSAVLIEPTATVFWPADFLPGDIPNSRIVTYGYDSIISNFFEGAASKNTIYQHAKDMLFKFPELREGCETRPIIFVAHSLGGILVKDVLRRSKGAELLPDAQPVFPATRAILFLGTPHRGSSYATWGEIARRIASTALMDTNPSLINSLKVDSSQLELLREEFSKMLRDPRLRIYSFQEAKGLAGIKGVNRKVVDDASSALDDAAETKITINENHMNMCRFGSSEDSGYRDLLSALRMSVKVIEREIEAQRKKLLTTLNREQEACLKTLHFDGWRNRHEGIEESHKSTLGWVNNNAILQGWMTGEATLTWVSGKPGCGKSTIAKHLLEKMEAQHKTTASFFFNDRGGELDKSEEGFLRAIVSQILRKIVSSFDHILQEYRLRVTESDKPVRWSTQSLKKMLISMIHALKDEPIWLVIDAFDECEEVSRDSLLDLVGNLATAPSVHILVTSRPNPIIIHRMLHHPTIQLDQLVDEDIKNYIAGEFDSLVNLNGRNSKAIDKLHRLVLQKSQGVFLWVKLVMAELKYGRIKGHTIQQMRDVIDTIPGDLEALYNRVFERLDPSRGDEVRRMLEWVLFAESPLTLSEFRYALAIGSRQGNGHDFDSLAAIDASESVVELSRMEQRVRDLCGGLLEVVEVSNGRARKEKEDSDGKRLVQIIHQSVKEFLLKKRIPGEDSQSRWITKPSSHTHLAQVCITYLSLSDFDTAKPPQRVPFHNYATKYRMRHANLAEGCGTVRQMKQLTRPGTKHFSSWVKSYRNYHWFSKDAEIPLTQLEIAARCGLFADVKYFLEHENTAGVKIPCNKTPTPKTGGMGLQQVVTGQNEGMLQPSAGEIQSIDDIVARDQARGVALGWAAFGGHCSIIQLLIDHGTDVNFGLSSGKFALFEATRGGQVHAVELLIKVHADVNFQGCRACSVLYHAVESVSEMIVKLLLDAGADVNVQRGKRGTVLHRAVIAGDVSIIQLLIDHNVDIDVQCGGVGTALCLAARRDEQTIVKLLIDHGADLDIVCQGLIIPIKKPGKAIAVGSAERAAGTRIAKIGPTTALRLAALYGHDKIVQLLIDHNADMDIVCEGSGTALLAAAESGMTETVKILLRRGAGADRRYGNFETPLLAASASGNEEIVRLLLNHGVDVNILGEIPQRASQQATEGLYDQTSYDSVEGLVDLIDADHGNTLLENLGGMFDTLFQEFHEIRTTERATPQTALFTAVVGGHVKIIQLLVDHAADVNIPSEMYGTALRHVAEEGNLEIAKLLLAHGAHVNDSCEGAPTALEWAALFGHTGMVQLLINHGADVSLESGRRTALVWAAAHGHSEIVGLLITHRADVNLVSQGEAALILAAEKGHQEIVHLLLAHGARVDIVCEYYGTALIQAAAEGHLEIVQLLLSHHANVNIVCDGFGTALLQAAKADHSEIVELLITHGADVNLDCGESGNALQAAIVDCDKSRNSLSGFMVGFEESGTTTAGDREKIRENREKIVKLLLNQGADVNIKGGKYGCPLAAAMAHGDQKIVQLLIDNGAVLLEE